MCRSTPEEEVLDFAAKNQWREREGWCSAEEAWMTLTGTDGSRCELLDEDEEQA